MLGNIVRDQTHYAAHHPHLARSTVDHQLVYQILFHSLEYIHFVQLLVLFLLVVLHSTEQYQQLTYLRYTQLRPINKLYDFIHRFIYAANYGRMML